LKEISEQEMNILDAYILTEPNEQNVLDIFKGEWSSRLPDKFGLNTEPGFARLFEDARVIWTEEVLGSFANWDILELGPLEGGHSYMFQERNANKVISIEANTRAYLKCLCIKEILKLNKVEFKLGDLMCFLENDSKKYDMVFASGVLYHMEDPIKLLKLISRVSERLFVWTHYYDKSVISEIKELSDKFGPVKTLEFDGMQYECATQSYKQALDWSGFCGGPKPTSKWLTRESILNALRRFGYTDIQVNFEHVDHQNGPSFALCASK
jgi:SAM-dependent methyltransferase